MPDRHCPAMPQVIAVDEQFGTHRGTSVIGQIFLRLMYQASR
jgi:hypothetical protein